MEQKAATSRRAFLLRKAHSLTGIIPVGVFLVEHLWTNSSALGGRAQFDHAVDQIQKLPALPIIEVFGIFLPLAFHAIYGIKLATEARPNPIAYVHGRNWLYVLQRVTGVLTLLFLCAHLWEFRVQKWLFGMTSGAFYDTLQAHLAATTWGLQLYALAYVLGLGSAVFHFGNGIVGFCLSWGLVVSRRAQRVVAWSAAALSVGLFLLGFSTIVFFSTGTRLLPTGQSALEPPCPESK